MKIKGRIKMLTTMFIVFARVNCDFLLDSLSEMKQSLQLLQESVDKIDEKVDQLQREISKVDNGVNSLSLEQIKNNEKFDQLHKDISKLDNEVKSLSMDINSMLGTNIDTLAENPDSTGNLDKKFHKVEEDRGK